MDNIIDMIYTAAFVPSASLSFGSHANWIWGEDSCSPASDCVGNSTIFVPFARPLMTSCELGVHSTRAIDRWMFIWATLKQNGLVKERRKWKVVKHAVLCSSLSLLTYLKTRVSLWFDKPEPVASCFICSLRCRWLKASQQFWHEF